MHGSGGVSRRQFLKYTAAAAAAMSANRILPGSAHAAARNKALPTPQRSGVQHIVVAMMENRSFDHLLGWLPGAERRQAGLTYPDRNGVAHPTLALTGDYQGCIHPDPDHSYEGGRIAYNQGACDGWLRARSNDDYAIGYYTQTDLPFLGQAATAWTTCDQYFTSIMAGTFANRIYQHAAQTDRLDNSLLPVSTLPTIWDRLADHDVSRRYYFSDFPFLALWGSKYLDISRPTTQFFADCAAGTLPSVSFVEPRFFGEAQGLSNDYHPHSDIRKGEVFLNSVYSAVTSSPNWKDTILVINFDEWGGFFDHVRPPFAAIPPADASLGADGLMGFRVPALVISPWSRRATVAHDTYDHTSVLKMIEWRWNLRPLTVRDANANNLAEVLDFDSPNLAAPAFNVPAGPYPQSCFSGAIVDREAVLGEFARLFGF
jgi:phospholipase C